MKEFLRKVNIKEILKFGVGGGCAVAVDFSVYYFLKQYIDLSIAKAISFVAGAIVGFIINKLWTFRSAKFRISEVLKYIVLYICSAAVNNLVNKGVLVLCNITLVAFLCATAISTIMNYLGQKFFVFNKGRNK